MKRFFIVILSVLMVCVSISFAESVDVTKLTFEELSELKRIVDNEYYTRSEAGEKILYAGRYIVGKDIPQGNYSMRVAYPNGADNYVEIEVFQTEEDYKKRNLSNAVGGRLYYGIIMEQYLHDGMVLNLKGQKLAINLNSMTKDAFPHYDTPEGTLVPPGIYVVGRDIPVGRYDVLAATLDSAYFAIYSSEESAKSEYSSSLESHRITADGDEFISINLEDKQAVVIKQQDVVMRKKTNEKLNFD